MKKILLFIILLILPLNIYAYCDYKTKADLNKLAGNVNYTYEAVYKDNYYYFNVKILNVNKNVYILDETTKKVYHYNSSGIIDVGTYKAGSRLTFKIYSDNQNVLCENLKLSTLYVNLPNYNEFYNNKLCEGIESYSLCQKWVKVNLTKEQFEKNVKDYIDSLNAKEEKPKNKETIIGLIMNFIIKYYPLILIIVIILGISGIVIIKNKEKKRIRYRV